MVLLLVFYCMILNSQFNYSSKQCSNVFLGNNKVDKEMQKPWQRTCVYAINLIQTTIEKLLSGKISANELNTLSSKEQQFLTLAHLLVSSTNLHVPEPDVLKTDISIRNEEYYYFVSFKQKLIFIASMIAKSGLAIEGQFYLLRFIHSVSQLNI